MGFGESRRVHIWPAPYHKWWNWKMFLAILIHDVKVRRYEGDKETTDSEEVMYILFARIHCLWFMGFRKTSIYHESRIGMPICLYQDQWAHVFPGSTVSAKFAKQYIIPPLNALLSHCSSASYISTVAIAIFLLFWDVHNGNQAIGLFSPWATQFQTIWNMQRSENISNIHYLDILASLLEHSYVTEASGTPQFPQNVRLKYNRMATLALSDRAMSKGASGRVFSDPSTIFVLQTGHITYVLTNIDP